MKCIKECEYYSDCYLRKIMLDIEELMTQYSWAEAVYNDILIPITTDDVIFMEDMSSSENNIEEWKRNIKILGMSYEDFLLNTAIAIISEVCSDISITKPYKFQNVEYRKRKIRSRKVAATRENLYGKTAELYNDIPINKLSVILKDEFLAVLHEEIDDGESITETRSTNPLLKLAESSNINLKHFRIDDLDEIIKYYQKICSFLSRDTFSEFERIILMYRLDIELRFLTIFKFLEPVSKHHNTDKESLEYARGLVAADRLVIRNGMEQIYTYRNLVYYGIDDYIVKLATGCINSNADQCLNTINDMYCIVEKIFALRDTVIINKKNQKEGVSDDEENYQQYVDGVFTNINYICNDIYKKQSFDFPFAVDNNIPCMELINRKTEDMRRYHNLNAEDVTNDYFVRMYMSDEKYDTFKKRNSDKPEKE